MTVLKLLEFSKKCPFIKMLANKQKTEIILKKYNILFIISIDFTKRRN